MCFTETVGGESRACFFTKQLRACVRVVIFQYKCLSVSVKKKRFKNRRKRMKEMWPLEKLARFHIRDGVKFFFDLRSALQPNNTMTN